MQAVAWSGVGSTLGEHVGDKAFAAEKPVISVVEHVERAVRIAQGRDAKFLLKRQKKPTTSPEAIRSCLPFKTAVDNFALTR